MEDQEVYEMIGMSNGTHAAEALPITALCALDKLFDAAGTAQVRVGTKLLAIPIQSVDLEFVEALCKPFRPKAPIRRENIAGKWETVKDMANEDYTDKLTHYNMLYAHVTACCGMTLDIRNANRDIVWSANNTIHDVEQAIKALKEMGLVLNHIVTINRAINDLTTYVDEERLRE
jgi:hypothetical protein